MGEGGHLVLSGDSFGFHQMTTKRGLCYWHLWVGPGMLLNILQHTGQRRIIGPQRSVLPRLRNHPGEKETVPRGNHRN